MHYYILQTKTGSRQQSFTGQFAKILKIYLEQAQADQVWFFPAQYSQTGLDMNIEKAFS